jgi:hypothetical protein
MSYKVSSIPIFDKQVKRLAKKYPSLKKDLAALINSLAEQPTQGDALGGNFYKVRMAITSKGRGKSGGARVITYLKVIQSHIYLTFMYDKSEKTDISFKELEQLFKMLP